MEHKQNILKGLKPREIIYPVISVAFFLVIAIAFFLNVRFITVNLNKMFYIPDQAEIESQMTKVDLENFYKVAKKIGINAGAGVAAEPQPQAEAPVVAEQPATTTSPVVSATVDKADLKVAVFNTTTTKGLAAAIKKDLEAAEFVVSETGNQAPLLEATQIKVKSSANGSAVIDELKQVVVKKYSSATIVADDSIAQDVVVLIGKQ